MQKTFFDTVKKVLKKAPFVASNGKAIRRNMRALRLYMAYNSTSPISDCYGFDRGTPLDRFYIESFLEKNKKHIQGMCLEVLDNTYTLAYGKNKVVASDVLDIDPLNKNVTLTADLRHMPSVSSNTYDCVILTQVLQFIDDPAAALMEVHRILRPGGYVLATLPSVSRIDCTSGIDGDFWRFTEASAKVLFKDFGEVEITARGNCRSGMLFLAGASKEEVSKKVLNTDDRQFPVVITVLAKKTS